MKVGRNLQGLCGVWHVTKVLPVRLKTAVAEISSLQSSVYFYCWSPTIGTRRDCLVESSSNHVELLRRAHYATYPITLQHCSYPYLVTTASAPFAGGTPVSAVASAPLPVHPKTLWTPPWCQPPSPLSSSLKHPRVAVTTTTTALLPAKNSATAKIVVPGPSPLPKPTSPVVVTNAPDNDRACSRGGVPLTPCPRMRGFGAGLPRQYYLRPTLSCMCRQLNQRP